MAFLNHVRILHNQMKHKQIYQFLLIESTEVLLITQKLAFYDKTQEILKIRSKQESEYDFSIYPEINLSCENLSRQKKKGQFIQYHVSHSDIDIPEINFQEITNREAYTSYIDSLDQTPPRPRYSHIYNAQSPFRKYKLNLPGSLPREVNDLLLEFEYVGNTAQIYADSLLIADDYYTGDKMDFALERNKEKLDQSEFIFQITPMMRKYPIYFDQDTKLDFVEDTQARLKRITVKPQYEAKIYIK